MCAGIRDWPPIAKLKQEGMDVQSHTFTHPNLNKASEVLEHEIVDSKQCFLQHGHNATIFSYQFGIGSNNATIVDMVAQSYSFARDYMIKMQPFVG
jgi:hypothetical protein